MTSKLRYHVIATGSQGNAVLIQDAILIDCGVPFRSLRPIYRQIRLVLLTHIHSDHFNRATLKKLAQERPTLRFGCGAWLVQDLVSCGVSKRQIDVLECDTRYGYGVGEIIPIPLAHNVPNIGYKLHLPEGKIIYATDTNNLNGITAKGYDLYMIEANHEIADLKSRIREKKADGQYAYEMQAIKNHLSKEKCDDFIYRNIGANGQYVYLHCHHEKTAEGA